MEFKTNDLLATLNKARAALSKKDIVATGKAFILTGDELITFNDQISIQVPFKTDFKCALLADDFYKVVSKLKAETVSLEYLPETNEISIKAGRVKAALICSVLDIDAIVKSVKADEKAEWNNLPEDFIDGVLMTVYSASADMTKPIFTCISVDPKGITSTDNLRISKYAFKNKKMKASFLLPATSALELLRHSSLNKYTVSDSWVFFKDTEGLFFSAKIMSGEFPDVTSFFDIEGTSIDMPDALIDSIETASILADGDFAFDKKIEVSYKKGKITCKGVSDDIGWVSSSVSCEHSDDLSFQINPVFFKEILKHKMKAQHTGNSLFFENDSFKHLVGLFS